MSESPQHRWYLRPVWISLALLFVVLAAVAATVGSYAWQRVAALAWVERLGGFVEFERLPEWVPERVAEYWPNWARRIHSVELDKTVGEDLGRLRMLREAKSVGLYWDPLSDSQMRPLSSFYQLRTLQFDASKVTDAGLAPLSRCRCLRELFLADRYRDEDARIAVGDEGLQHLAGLPIEELELSKTLVTDAGMDTLSHLPRLKALHLNYTFISDAGLERLKSLPLEWLGLTRTRVTDAGLSVLGTMSHLEDIVLDDTEIGDAGLARLATAPRLETLRLSHTQVTNAGLAHMSKLPLRFLDVSYTAVDDEGLQHLRGLKTLKTVDLTGTKCTERGAQELAESLGLKLDRMRLK